MQNLGGINRACSDELFGEFWSLSLPHEHIHIAIFGTLTSDGVRACRLQVLDYYGPEIKKFNLLRLELFLSYRSCGYSRYGGRDALEIT